MAERDPAFLYYDADVALDVAHMSRTEKGCYLDLVQLYRRYHGYTMVQIRKVLGIDFESCWNALELVLVLDGELYHIPWLRNSLINKAKRSEKQRENVNKRWSKAKKGDTNTIPPYNNGNSEVLPNDLIGNTSVIPIIETETETKNRLEEEEGGTGEEAGGREGFSGSGPPQGSDWPVHASGLPQAMVEIFVKTFPSYARDDSKDFAACLQIGYCIADQNRWPWQSAINGRMPEVLGKWKEIVAWIPGSEWFRTKPLTFLASNFQGIIQAKNYGTGQQKNLRVVAPAGNGQDPTAIGRTGFGDI